jgi:outer membrane protein assembly factor BamB
MRSAEVTEVAMTRSVRITALGIVLLAFASAAAMAPAPTWPQFRGANSSGIGAGKPPVEFGPDRGVLWKIPVGAGLSSPVVWGERIFLTEVDQANRRFTTLCIERRTGRIQWRRSVTAEEIEKVHNISSPAGATPVTDGERVYVYFGSYGLLA